MIAGLPVNYFPIELTLSRKCKRIQINKKATKTPNKYITKQKVFEAGEKQQQSTPHV